MAAILDAAGELLAKCRITVRVLERTIKRCAAHEKRSALLRVFRGCSPRKRGVH